MPGGAHLLALPNKIHMSAADYLIAQQIYRGWAFIGIVDILAIVATALLAWRSPTMRAPALVALACLVLMQVVFWSLNFPGNQQTQNWTTLPANWETLRTRWEIGHAISAGLNVTALIALLVGVLRRNPVTT